MFPGERTRPRVLVIAPSRSRTFLKRELQGNCFGEGAETNSPRDESVRLADTGGRLCSPNPNDAVCASVFAVLLEKIRAGNTRLRTDRAQSRCFERRVIRHRQWSASSVWVLSHHGNVLALADHFEPKCAQCPNNSRLRRIGREFHPVMSEASVTKASITSS